jgi:hypothetical protein
MPATPVISAIGTGIFEDSASSIDAAKIAIATLNLCGRCSSFG